MEINRVKFTQPKSLGGLSHPTPHLYVANCGPAVGLSLERIAAAFGTFGTVTGVQVADESGTRVVVTFRGIAPAQAAKEAWDGTPCSYLDARVLHMQYSVPQAPCQVEDTLPVFRVSAEMGIPGIFLIHDFVSEQEEHELLAAVDERPWQGLMKRRVQHYGYEFMYKTRNVDTKQYLGQLPVFLLQLLNRMALLPEVNQAENSLPFDQLTDLSGSSGSKLSQDFARTNVANKVNEYPAGVGLSPHIDTHSAFQGCILSLSLAGPCVMEFRRYTNEAWSSQKMDIGFARGWLNNDISGMMGTAGKQQQGSKQRPQFERKAIFLPSRSLLVLSEEARYAWHHYIPHHKVRFGPCNCRFQQYCDSQSQVIDSLGQPELKTANNREQKQGIACLEE